MTEDDIRHVFEELRRVGVDLDRPPGLAIGTGFGDGELLPWLRALPDGLGHDEFAARISAYVTAAQPNAELPTRADGKPYRGWPTVEQLHAAADVLAREWDPLGARLGDLTREDVVDFVSQIMPAAFMEQSTDTLQHQIARFLRQVEETEFSVRPSPVEQRRYLARRILQVIVDNPGEPHERHVWDDVGSEHMVPVRRRPLRDRSASVATAPARRQVVGLGPRSTDPTPLDSTAACGECGSIGTVAVVVRDHDPSITRFCAACWPKARETYWMNWSSFPKPPENVDTPEGHLAMLEWIQHRFGEFSRHDARYVASAMWDDRAAYVEAALVQTAKLPDTMRELELRTMADDMVKNAPHMYGPMPRIIESFVEKYR